MLYHKLPQNLMVLKKKHLIRLWTCNMIRVWQSQHVPAPLGISLGNSKPVVYNYLQPLTHMTGSWAGKTETAGDEGSWGSSDTLPWDLFSKAALRSWTSYTQAQAPQACIWRRFALMGRGDAWWARAPQRGRCWVGLSLDTIGQDEDRKGAPGRRNSKCKGLKAEETPLCLWNAGCMWQREREKTGNSQRWAGRWQGPPRDWIRGAIGPDFCGSEEDDQREGSLETARSGQKPSALLQALEASPGVGAERGRWGWSRCRKY